MIQDTDSVSDVCPEDVEYECALAPSANSENRAFANVVTQRECEQPQSVCRKRIQTPQLHWLFLLHNGSLIVAQESK